MYVYKTLCTNYFLIQENAKLGDGHNSKRVIGVFFFKL